MDYKDVNDYEVIYMIRENDDDAINVLIDKYKPLVEKKIKKWGFVLKKRNLYVEDLRQELNLCIVKAVKNYKEENDVLLYTYINRSLDGYMMGYLSKYIKDERVVSLNNQIDEEGLQFIDMLPDNYNNPDNEIDAMDKIDYVDKFLYTLPMEQSTIFEMHLNGFKVDEIAKLVEKTPGSVRTTISRIKQKLKEEMSKKN